MGKSRLLNLLIAQEDGKSSEAASIIPPAGWGRIVDFAKVPRGAGHAEERLKARTERDAITCAFAELLGNVRGRKCRAK